MAACGVNKLLMSKLLSFTSMLWKLLASMQFLFLFTIQNYQSSEIQVFMCCWYVLMNQTSCMIYLPLASDFKNLCQQTYTFTHWSTHCTYTGNHIKLLIS